MISIRPNFRLLIALAILVLALAIFLVTAFATYQKRTSAESWKAHGYQVLLETSEIRSSFGEAQTGIRGYVLTGDDTFLKGYLAGQNVTNRHLRNALQLTRGDEAQQQRLHEVQHLFQDWQAGAEQERRNRDSARNGEDPFKLLLQNSARANQMRTLLQKIEDAELVLLAERVQEEQLLRFRMEWITLFGSILGVCLVALLTGTLVRNFQKLYRVSKEMENHNRERQQAEEAVREVNQQLTVQIAQLEVRNREIEILSESVELLQACHQMSEACEVITTVIPKLFPDKSGAVYLFNSSGNFLERIVDWKTFDEGGKENSPPFREPEYFAPNECWALRRGQLHEYLQDTHEMSCQHFGDPVPPSSICVPLMAQGNVIGMLHLYQKEKIAFHASSQKLARAAGEHIALAIANLQLRETLQHQSIRDPLTNLYNRRYLEESLERELQRARRNRDSLAVLMLDIDHFKRFNDSYGHEAGDLLLQTVAKYLLDCVRGSDIACRYGGEELTLVFPEADAEATYRRAEEIRQHIAELRVEFRGGNIGPVTISIGVALFPQDARTPAELLQTADVALYQAKSLGRNKVVTAQSLSPADPREMPVTAVNKKDPQSLAASSAPGAL